MRKFDLSLRSSRSSYFATFRHQLTILSKTDALDEEKWLNMLGTFVKDWFRYESHRSEERRVGKEWRDRWARQHCNRKHQAVNCETGPDCARQQREQVSAPTVIRRG